MRAPDLFDSVYGKPRGGGRASLTGYECRYCGHFLPKVSTVSADMLSHAEFHLVKQDFELLAQDENGPRFRPRFGRPPQPERK